MATGIHDATTQSGSSSTPAVAVVIPVYRSAPNALEAIALTQCCKLLGRHPIIFVCADTFDITPYLQFCGRHGIQALVECFEPHWFSSVATYNRLLFDRRFYQRFTSHNHILLYQLDAFVFKDDLTYWCDQGYDYVGAPFFQGWDHSTPADPMLPSGGNGGLSLRRIEAFLTVLTPPFPRARMQTWDDLWRRYQGRSLFGKATCFPRLLNRYRRKSNLYGNYLSDPAMFEDEFFSYVVPRIFPRFKVAPSSAGMFFAFECQPRRLLELTAGELPFGCHAWERYDIGFWKPFIESFGHVIPEDRTSAAHSSSLHRQRIHRS